MLRTLVIGWLGMLAAVAATAAPAPASAPPTRAQVEQAVIASVPAWHEQHATIVRYLDLTPAFHTTSPRALVVVQDPHRQQDTIFNEPNPLLVCIVNALTPHCTESLDGLSAFSPGAAACTYKYPCYSGIYGVSRAKVVFVGTNGAQPLLLLKLRSMSAPDGSTPRWTVLYRYERNDDRFRAVFVNAGGGNNNQHARFVASGPLQGDEIVDFPTEHAPYVYWVEVYAPHGDGPYRRILRYRSSTHYGDGNPLPVAASEMAGIMQRLGLWKPGDALPIPQPLPANCGRLVLNRGEEWCQNLCANYGGSACGRINRIAAKAVRKR